MRKVRTQCESNIYHVMNRGASRQLIYEDDADRIAFLDLLSDEAAKLDVEIFAWCLMGNHFHLILHAPMENVSELMRRLCARYAARFNKRHQRCGHLFQDRFASEAIDTDEYLLTAVRYVHENPEKGGLASIEDYPWSSFREYAGDGMCVRRICACDFVSSCFGGIGSFREFHRASDAGPPLADVDVRRTRTTAMADEVALQVAEEALGGAARLSELKAMPRKTRNALLGELIDAGLSVRQIERLTGIGRGIIQRAKR